MPVVISYEGVEALGALSHGAGELAGQAQRGREDMQMLTQIEQDRQGMAMQAQQAERDRDLRRELLGREQGFRREQVQYEQQALEQEREAAIAEAQQERRGQLERELLEQHGLMQRDALQHQQRMQRDDRQAELGRWQGRQEPAMPGQAGLPPREQVETEMRRFGHLLPFDEMFSADTAAGDADKLRKTAETITGLPTVQLERMAEARPDDPMNPYIGAILEARRGVTGGGGLSRGARQVSPPGRGGGSPVPRGANPEAGRRRTQQPGAGRGGGGVGGRGGSSLRGDGLGGDPLQSLSNEQLRRLADNPEMIERMAPTPTPQAPPDPRRRRQPAESPAERWRGQVGTYM